MLQCPTAHARFRANRLSQNDDLFLEVDRLKLKSTMTPIDRAQATASSPTSKHSSRFSDVTPLLTNSLTETPVTLVPETSSFRRFGYNSMIWRTRESLICILWSESSSICSDAGYSSAAGPGRYSERRAPIRRDFRFPFTIDGMVRTLRTSELISVPSQLKVSRKGSSSGASSSTPTCKRVLLLRLRYLSVGGNFGRNCSCVLLRSRYCSLVHLVQSTWFGRSPQFLKIMEVAFGEASLRPC